MEEELSHVKPNNNSQAEVTKSHRPYLRWWPYLSGKEGAVTWEKKKKRWVGHTVKRRWAKRIKYKWTGELKHLAEKGESRIVVECSVLQWLSSSGSSQVILMGSLVMSFNHPFKMSSPYCITEAISSPHLSVTFSRADLFSLLLLNSAWNLGKVYRDVQEQKEDYCFIFN